MDIVKKPWGYEKWIGEGRGFFLKDILIRAGHKTSLQYHNKKDEINLIIQGQGVLTRDNQIIPLMPDVSFHITPKVVHRVEALTDLRMVEASTTELEDVVRLQDDYGRAEDV